MAHSTSLPPLVPVERGGRPTGKAVDAIKRWRRAYAAWRKRRQTEAILRGLDDRMLKDIGLNRSQIAAAALLGGRPRR